MINNKQVKWHVRELLEATGGTLVAGPETGIFAGICIDSRIIRNDQVFLAIRGERYDGHAFIPKLMEAGIKGFVVDRPPDDSQQLVSWAAAGGCCIVVADTIRTLGDLAAFHRRRMGIPVAAITGSNGKTTTREMAVSVVSLERHTLSTQGNFNNEIGLPLTLLRLDHSHQAAVVELGMNHPGEIDRLAAISLPDIGLITNIGPAHLEGMRDIERVMAAKAEMLSHVKPEGMVVLNGDDAFAARLGAMAQNRVLYFGMGTDPAVRLDVRAESVRQKGVRTEFTLVLPDERIAVALNAPGQYMIANALAAAAVGHALGLSGVHIRKGLADFRPVPGRMAHCVTSRGINLIDDAYNANPASMKAAIDALAVLKGSQRAILVAGDMLELGEGAAAFHYEVGKEAAVRGIDRLYASGAFAGDIVKGAISAGMAANAIFVGSKAEIIDQLVRDPAPGDWVLVKGSRSTGMDQIARHLLQYDKQAAAERGRP